MADAILSILAVFLTPLLLAVGLWFFVTHFVAWAGSKKTKATASTTEARKVPKSVITPDGFVAIYPTLQSRHPIGWQKVAPPWSEHPGPTVGKPNHRMDALQRRDAGLYGI